MPKLGESLSGMSTSPFAALGGLGGMFDQSAKDEMQSIKEEVDSSELVLPGLDEAIAFDELLKHVENPSWDVIVFDTAPTGHTLRFLSLPELIEAWSGRLLRMMRVSGGIRSMLFGRKQSDAMKEERAFPSPCFACSSCSQRSIHNVVHFGDDSRTYGRK